MFENLIWPVLVGSLAWLVAKRWEIAERRRLRYIEIVSRLSALFVGGTPTDRQVVLNEFSKLWIDADLNVIRNAERALDAIEFGDERAELRIRELVASMRRDARFLWNRDDLSPDDIKLRTARRDNDEIE